MARKLDTYRKTPRDEPYLDVWSRTAPRYRRRSIVLLIVTALLFAGLCCFAYWLRTGEMFPGPANEYFGLIWKSINPVGSDQITLVDFLLFPISVEQVPVQMVIMGLLLASLATIPILVGILYRLPSAVAFVLMIAVLAAMPWFAATILLGCVIAAHPAFRMHFRYANAVLGLVPIVIYYVMATREPEATYSAAAPYGFKLYAPWVLAVLFSCVIAALVLLIARAINYRPGGIAPVLAITFAVPVILFHAEVGRDELAYRLIEREFGPNSERAFVTVNLRETETEQAERAWKRARSVMFDTIFVDRKRRRAQVARQDLAEDRLRAVEACDEFMTRFRDSEYVPCVLYLKGLALDRRMSEVALESNDRIEYHALVPSVAATSVWETLAIRYPQSEPAAVALNRLATLDLRDGRIDRAAQRLDLLMEHFATLPAGARSPSARDRHSLFAKMPPAATLGIDVAAEVLRARRLREMIAQCHDEPPSPFSPFAPDLGLIDGPPTHPLAAFVSLDPTAEDYGVNLSKLLIAYPASRIGPFVAAQLAALEPSPHRRIEQLTRAETRYRGMPGCAEVMLHHAESLKEVARFADAARVFTRLLEEYPESCWAAEARRRQMALTMLLLPS